MVIVQLSYSISCCSQTSKTTLKLLSSLYRKARRIIGHYTSENLIRSITALYVAAARGHTAQIVYTLLSFYLFTQPKELHFTWLWRATCPIHKGHWPCISVKQYYHSLFALPMPCCVCAIFPLGGLHVFHPYLLWPGCPLQANLWGRRLLT